MTYSAIIVLGNLMNKSGLLNSESSSRMDIAIKIFYKKQAPLIVTCGWAYRNDSSIALANAMKLYAIKIRNVPSKFILTEENSRDTVGDAVFTKKHIALNREWNNLLVVTSDYHILRAYEIFTYVYGKNFSIKVIGADTDNNKERIKNEKKSIQMFYDTFTGIEAGDDTLIYKRLCEQHPYYNGMVHPKLKIN